MNFLIKQLNKQNKIKNKKTKMNQKFIQMVNNKILMKFNLKGIIITENIIKMLIKLIMSILRNQIVKLFLN